jgi:hypothetical protein
MVLHRREPRVLHRAELFSKPGHMGAQQRRDRGAPTHAEASRLGGAHRHEFTTALHERQQILRQPILRQRIGKRARRRLDGLSEAGEHHGVEGVGLGGLPNRLGEGAHLARVHHSNAQSHDGELGCDGGFVSPCRFQHCQFRRSLPCPVHQFSMATRFVGKALRLAGGQERHIQVRFGDSDVEVV